MPECKRKEPLCGCIEWKEGNLADKIHHVISNFEFTGFELEYTSLEPEKGRLLCKVGRCRTCGKRLCIGEDLPDESTPDDLLADIFRRTFRMWNADGTRLPDGVDTFPNLFLPLFHEPDREYVGEWLKRLAEDARLGMGGEDV